MLLVTTPMRVGISIHKDRVSPLFDVSRTLRLIEVEGCRVRDQEDVRLETSQPVSRARRIATLDVHVLICGAISRQLEAILFSAGVWVVSNTCGSVDSVQRAFLDGQLTEQAFPLPGCCGRCRRMRRHRWGGRPGRG